MDADRFDSFTKTLTTPPTRRAVLRLLGGATLGGPLATVMLARLGVTPDLAADKKKNKPKKKQKKCEDDEKKCGGKCIAKNDCCHQEKRSKNATSVGSCGACERGKLRALGDDVCRPFDPEGCTVCNPQTFNCEPGNEGQECGHALGVCGVCRSGICEPDGRERCGGQCHQPCPAGRTRDPYGCQCVECPPGTGQVQAAALCCPDGRSPCGEGTEVRCCGADASCNGGLCRSDRCPAPDWYVCGATCCWSGTGGTYKCCQGDNGVDFCCNPGLECVTVSGVGCKNPGP